MGDFKKVRLFCGLLQFNSIFLPTVLSSGQDIYLENTFLKCTDFHRILKTISSFSPLTFEFSRNTQKVRQAENKRNNSVPCHLSFLFFVHEVSLLSSRNKKRKKNLDKRVTNLTENKHSSPVRNEKKKIIFAI